MPKGSLLPERTEKGGCPRCRSLLKGSKFGGRTAYCFHLSLVPPQRSLRALQRARGEHPSAIADDAVARAGRVSGVAHCEAPCRQAAAAGLNQQAGYGEAAAGLLRAK